MNTEHGQLYAAHWVGKDIPKLTSLQTVLTVRPQSNLLTLAYQSSFGLTWVDILLWLSCFVPQNQDSCLPHWLMKRVFHWVHMRGGRTEINISQHKDVNISSDNLYAQIQAINIVRWKIRRDKNHQRTFNTKMLHLNGCDRLIHKNNTVVGLLSNELSFSAFQVHLSCD